MVARWTAEENMSSRKELRDAGFQNNVREKLKMMGKSREFSDVTLTSEDGISFPAHKVILAAAGNKHLLQRILP